MQPRQARRPFPAQGCISKILHKGMDGIRWTLVQKRNIQRLQTDFERCVDTVEFPVSQCKPSDTGASESQNGVGVGPRVAAPVKHEQTSISSLIGVPFIVRSHQEVGESKVGDESPNVTKRFKNDNTFKKSGSVRGLLRINPNQLDQETVCGVARNEQEAKDLSDINESDWPSISAYHTRNEDGVSNSESDGKSWSTVLRTVTLPKPVKKEKASAKSTTKHDSDSGDKGETSRLGAATDKRRHQPLMLEFDSLFQALQIQGSKKVVTSGGGGAPVLLSKPPTKVDTQRKVKESSRSGNILDSSAPATRRGKEREVPKKKRPSTLRKVITSEKERRKVGGTQVDAEETTSSETEPKTVVHDKPKPTIHNRRFREYCNHLVNKEINTCAEQFLVDLARFQDRMYLKDPIKAKAKRRYVCGLREVLKHLKLKRIKCIILPPNLDRIQSEGGIYDMIGQIVDLCSEQEIPTVFAMSRRRLALVLKKRHKVGCVGVFSYDGAEKHYKQLMSLVETATTEYDARVAALEAGLKLTQSLTVEEDPSPSCRCDPLEVLSGSSCGESTDSDVEDNDAARDQRILSSPWKIFFEQSTEKDKEEQVKTSESKPLNVNASEFTPSFKLNVEAEEFVPVYSCD